MDNAAKAHNDSLMETGYQILQRCKDKSIPCFLWAGGAIYHMLGGKLDYRKMSDLEFFIPSRVDTEFKDILKEMGFYANKPFNNIQNMSRTPRREFYRPNREINSNEIEELEHGRKGNIEDVEFEKVKIFVNGIKICWTFKFKELPKSYKDTLICPPGFQIALKANAIHPDDFDLKDIQDISSVVSSACCGEISTTDSIFTEPHLNKEIRYSIGTEIFKVLSKLKFDFPTTIIRNLSECLTYSGLTETGRANLLQLIDFVRPFKKQKGLMSKVKMQRPQRVDPR
jgi:hypothetical protein